MVTRCQIINLVRINVPKCTWIYKYTWASMHTLTRFTLTLTRFTLVTRTPSDSELQDIFDMLM